MILIHLSVILVFTGIALWIVGAILYKRANHLEKKKRKKWQQIALRIGLIAKILLVVAALVYIWGVTMTQGVKMTAS